MSVEIKTVREWLEPMGGAARVHVKNEGLLNALTASPQLCSSEGTGYLQVTAGGKVIMTLKLYATDTQGKPYPLRDSIAVVYSDSDKKAWLRKGREGGDLSGLGTCPHPRLCLYQIG